MPSARIISNIAGLSALSLSLVFFPLAHKADAQARSFDLENLTDDTPLVCDPFIDPGCNLAPKTGPSGCTDCAPGQSEFGSILVQENDIILEPRNGEANALEQLFERVTPGLLDGLNAGPATGF